MAKAQTMKPKSSFADWLKRLTAPKSAKAPARPPGQSSTLTNIPAAGAPATRPGQSAKAAASAAATRKAPAPRASGWSLADFRVPFIANRPILTQMQVLGTAAIVLLALIGLLVFEDTQTRTRNATFISIASQMQYHTQRRVKAAGLAARGQAAAFPQLEDSRTQLAQYLAVLRDGGVALGVNLPSAASNEELAGRLAELEKRWPESQTAAASILAAQKDLVALAKNIAQIRLGAEELGTQSQELTGLMTQSGSPPTQVLRANRLTFLAERLGRGAAEILGSETIDPEVPFLIGKDTNDMRELLNALESGNEATGVAALRDTESRAKLADLKKQFASFEQNARPILRELQKLVAARQAGTTLVAASEQLTGSVKTLQDAFQDQRSTLAFAAVVMLSVLLVAVLAVTALAFLADSRRSAAEAETENKRNQEAILRLLNEMGDLADGDLTVRAIVTEDITGAIADSMNYTVEELRNLVTGVNNAAIQVTQKTAHAQSISAELLGAAERQSKEIEETTAQLLQVSRSISDESSSEVEGECVDQVELAAADKGRAAVQNSISGMNDIREQIQETSKRIKRLGESSQEIGEIVELISDITEQTNVLALNAAIQAASAGEAGRGFSVVAEEVQRLAERSGEATKHITAIVKSIQRDTQDAVEAMERSTRGVVDGTKTADQAGEELREIEQVSKRLDELIGAISNATQEQAASAAQVAGKMKIILGVTQLPTEGTKKTAASAAKLGELADGLKNSVAGFKLA